MSLNDWISDSKRNIRRDGRAGITTSFHDFRDSIYRRFSRLISTSRWKQGVVTFDYGTFVSGANERYEFSARLYYELRLLRKVIDDFDLTIDQSLEIGSGYGRLSPWIAECSRKHHGIEPNIEVVEAAQKQYPEITFENALADNIPYPDDYFDLIVTWTVLQHIPPTSIEEVQDEIIRVLAPGGIIIICEETHQNRQGTHVWPRSIQTYQELFEPLTFVYSRPRKLEPTYLGTDTGHLLIFRAND